MKQCYVYVSYSKLQDILDKNHIKYQINDDWMCNITLKSTLGMIIKLSYYRDGYFGSISISYKDFSANIEGEELDISIDDSEIEFCIKVGEFGEHQINVGEVVKC